MLHYLSMRKVFLNTLCEFGPILAFMATYTFAGFEAGTIAMLIAVMLALMTLWHYERHLPLFALLSTVTILVFGSISLFVHIPSIFILRDTLFDALFGSILLVSVYRDTPLLKPLFHHVFHISDRGWSRLTLRWAVFFIALAVLNEWVRLHQSPDDWVAFKAYGILITVCFGLYQFTLTRRERLPNASPWGLVR